jgi:hypothetical protein
MRRAVQASDALNQEPVNSAMNDTYIFGLGAGLVLGMVILMTGFFRRKPGEYLDDRKNRKFLVWAFLFFGVAFICTMLLIFTNL